MAKYTLKTPMRVGDLTNGFAVDSLDLVSISINFQPEKKNAVVSCMLQHLPSGWTHTVTLSENTGHVWDTDNRPVTKGQKADELWAALRAEFPTFEQKVLELLQEHLPEGTVS